MSLTPRTETRMPDDRSPHSELPANAVDAVSYPLDLDSLEKRAGWALDKTRMAKSGYAPRKDALARQVIALCRELRSTQERLEALQAASRKFLATGNEIDLVELTTPGEYLFDLIPHRWPEDYPDHDPIPAREPDASNGDTDASPAEFEVVDVSEAGIDAEAPS